ncbi:MAG: heat-inducible transcriptional repressor HrcA [Alphaproteobacteria bacterium]|nr:heat-inducible transcriptional repressor HrcA [Alphaproteobacteria bacterium]MDP6815697.1 heat-inducible transcriptional repressor HrcA [Alphaproteobacteria bacterium]
MEINALDKRNREIFREIVESFMETGSPVGSRTLSRRINGALSPASVRNIMADLEDAGLLSSPHTSAGRLPTEAGLRLFIDGLLEVGDLGEDERGEIEARCAAAGRSMEDMLTQASEMLSGLSGWAGLVLAPKLEAPLKHVEFVSLGAGRVLMVIVGEAGAVENRIIEVPAGLPPSALVEAANYLNDRLRGRTLAEARRDILSEIERQQAELDELTARVVESGLAIWGGGEQRPTLIVRGRANLLEDLSAAEDLERARQLFEDLESKQALIGVLELANEGAGVRVFVGSESQLFSLTGSSMIVAPYSNSSQEVVGAIGVVGPTHLNYARIVPMVDYTAKVIGRLIG